ncbi:MAG: S8 family serine peptidase, partial [Eggerthellaceae bacterium]|nr:S8 family serine peptidase [Eggerthellaceae bacterium]
GHGTHVCGIVSAVADNELGIAGASFNANLLPIKVFNDEEKSTLLFGEEGSYAETEWIIRAYNYLFDLMDSKELTDLHVINMSLGGYDPLKAEDAVLEAAIETMRDDYAVLTVCAGGNGDLAGNAQTIASYPSDFDACFSVTALAQSGENTKWSDYNAAKDISAPGDALYSTYFSNNSSYRSMSGTSMASPLVAGIAALLWSVEPDLSVDQVIEAILATAIPLDASGKNYHTATETGSPGAIDAAAAVDYVFDHFSDDPRINIRDAEVAPIEFEYYTGTERTPSVTVTYEGKTLEEGVDYQLSYSDNVKVGKGRVTVSGIGRFRGAQPVRFDICYDLADNECFRAQALGTRLYTGQPICPTPRAFYNDVALVMGEDFTVTYEDNISGRPARAILEGIGNYRGTQVLYFNIKGAPSDDPIPELTIANGQAPQWLEGQPAAFTVTLDGLMQGETVENWLWEYTKDGTSWKRTGAAFTAEGATCTLTVPSCTEARKPPMAWRCTATTSAGRTATSDVQSMLVVADFALATGAVPYWVAGKPAAISVVPEGLASDESVVSWLWEYSKDGLTWKRTGAQYRVQ